MTKSSFFRGLSSKSGKSDLWWFPSHHESPPKESEAPSPPVRGFFIVGKLIKSGPDHHSQSFPRRPGPPRSGGLACPPSSADRQFLERGSTEVKEGGSDDLSICELDADWATEVPEHGLSPALTRHFEQRGAFLYPVRFEGID